MRKVLVIEDDFYIRQFYTQSFIKANYQVNEASNGTDALKLLEKDVYDVILLDIMLPKVDGMNILRIIRMENSLNSKSVVFVMTNKDDMNDKKEAFEIGVDKYFIKANFAPKEIVHAAEESLLAKVKPTS